MHEVPVNHFGGLSLPKKSVVRLTDRPDMTLDVYCGRKTTNQQQQQLNLSGSVTLKPIIKYYFLLPHNNKGQLLMVASGQYSISESIHLQVLS